MLTAPWRAWPDFVVIGAQKAGTSSLFNYLCQHPQVIAPAGKELRALGAAGLVEAWRYRAHFPYRRELAAAGALTFEATPTYLVSQHTPRRCARGGPPHRFVAILRDPVERTLSHFAHIRRFRSNRPVPAAPGTDDGYVRTADNPAGWGLVPHRHDPVARSIYDVQLRRWFECVGRDAVHVLFLEELVAAPESVLAELFDFLGLPPCADIELGAHNVTPTRHRLAEEALREQLAGRFAPANERLAELLNRSLPWPS